jgi:RNA polymerase sigma factor (sigma-70 family)
MTSPPLSEWPTDPDGLAAIVADSRHPEPTRNRAFQELLPVIRFIARRVAARFSVHYRDDLLDDAAGEVWQALTRSRPEESFEAWCYGVLRHHLLDRFRKEQRERNHQRTMPQQSETPNLQEALERALDRQEPFRTPDLVALRAWPLPQRLMVLSLIGLWEKVPRDEWKAWAGEYRTATGDTLPDPFPPEELEECGDIAQRNAVLSDAMGVLRNTLSVWLYRYKGRLRELEYVRALLDKA